MKFHQLGGQEKKERDLLARRAKAEKQRDIAQEDLNGQASDFSLILRASLAVVVMPTKYMKNLLEVCSQALTTRFFLLSSTICSFTHTRMHFVAPTVEPFSVNLIMDRFHRDVNGMLTWPRSARYFAICAGGD